MKRPLTSPVNSKIEARSLNGAARRLDLKIRGSKLDRTKESPGVLVKMQIPGLPEDLERPKSQKSAF